MKYVKVLVMGRSIENELWNAEYIGIVIEETKDMYLVKRTGLAKLFYKAEWLPKKGYLLRCELINNCV